MVFRFFILRGFTNEGDWSTANGEVSRNQSYIHLAAVQRVFWELVSSIPLTAVEQIQSATVMSNLPVNTDPPLNGTVYWLTDLNLLIHVYPCATSNVFLCSCHPRFVNTYLWHFNSLFIWKKCTVTSEFASTGSLSKYNSQFGAHLQLFVKRVLIRQTNYMCLCPHLVSISARQDLIHSSWLC